ncbi:hypothetical protein GQ457_13G018070 [Hibiscus cannabinus]
MANLPLRLHWQGIWQCFDRHGVVVDVFIPVKREVEGTRFGFVCMASWEDVLRVIECLDGFVLYGSRVIKDSSSSCNQELKVFDFSG